MEENKEMNPDIYTLVDEDGCEQTFELLDVMEEKDERYFALIPCSETSEETLEGDGNLVILKSQMVDGEEMMASIDDDDEYERIGDLFIARLQDIFDDESETDE